jgi:hypothetical protein
VLVLELPVGLGQDEELVVGEVDLLAVEEPLEVLPVLLLAVAVPVGLLVAGTVLVGVGHDDPDGDFVGFGADDGPGFGADGFFGRLGAPSGGPGLTGGSVGCCFGGDGLLGTIGTVRPGTPRAYTRSSSSTSAT